MKNKLKLILEFDLEKDEMRIIKRDKDIDTILLMDMVADLAYDANEEFYSWVSEQKNKADKLGLQTKSTSGD